MRSIFFILILSLFLSCNKQINCSEFHTGKFRIIVNRNNDTEQYLIERNDSLQIEKNLVNGKEATLAVKWVNECEYHLSFIEGPTEMKEVFESYNNTLVVKITSKTQNGYQYSGRFEGSDYESNFEAQRVSY